MAEGIRHDQLLGIRKVPKVYDYIEQSGSIVKRLPLTVQAALIKCSR